jgi:hypothetical protein
MASTAKKKPPCFIYALLTCVTITCLVTGSTVGVVTVYQILRVSSSGASALPGPEAIADWPTATPLPAEPPEIVSDETSADPAVIEVTLERFRQDAAATELIDWAASAGYLADASPVAAGMTCLSDGKCIDGIVFDTSGDPITALRFIAPDGSAAPLLATVEIDPDADLEAGEGITLVLFDQLVRAEATKDGADVFPLSQGSTRQGPVACPRGADRCTTGTWGDFKSCIKDTSSAWHYALVTGCMLPAYALYQAKVALTAVKAALAVGAATVAEVGAAAVAFKAALIAALVSCGLLLIICLPYGIIDNAPETNLRLMEVRDDSTWMQCNSEKTGYSETTVYQIQIDARDDRDPQPAGVLELLPADTDFSFDIKDCSDQVTTVQGRTPPGSTDLRFCDDGYVCTSAAEGQVECVAQAEEAGEEPEQPGEPVSAAGTVDVEGGWDCSRIEIRANEVHLTWTPEGPASGSLEYQATCYQEYEGGGECPKVDKGISLKLNGIQEFDFLVGDLTGTAWRTYGDAVWSDGMQEVIGCEQDAPEGGPVETGSWRADIDSLVINGYVTGGLTSGENSFLEYFDLIITSP